MNALASIAPSVACNAAVDELLRARKAVQDVRDRALPGTRAYESLRETLDNIDGAIRVFRGMA